MITSRAMGCRKSNRLSPRETINDDVEKAPDEQSKKDNKKYDHEFTAGLPVRPGRSDNLAVLPDTAQRHFGCLLRDRGPRLWQKQ